MWKNFKQLSLFTSFVVERFVLGFSILFFGFLAVASSAQSALPKAQHDSLWSIWSDVSQPDTHRLKAIQHIAWYGYLYNRPDSTYYCAQLQFELAKSKGLKKQMSSAKIVQGVSWKIRGNYPAALGCYQRSLEILEEIGDENGKASPLGSIGNIYFSQGDNDKALDYFQRSLEIFENKGDQAGIAASHSNMGLIYKEQGELGRALEYYRSSLKLREEIGDKKGIAITLNNTGNIYLIEKDYTQALNYYLRSLKIYSELNDKMGVAKAKYSIGSNYSQQKDLKTALLWCNEGYLIAEEIGAITEQKEACKCLYDIYKKLGNGNMALIYLEKMSALEDSLQGEETTKKLQQMEFQKAILQDSIFKAEEARLVREAHQEEVRLKNQTRNVLIGSSLFLFLLAGGLFSRWRYIRRSKAVLQEEKDRSDNLLLNILPADIAAELKEKGRADARDFDLVSIIFTDFKGFTEASAKLSAQELVAEINTCFEAFDGIMAKYSIEKIKTIGDAYMAAGGLPIPQADSVKNTVLAALEMQAFITKRKADNEAQNKPAFEMRVGIHTGPVVAGIVGIKKFQYDIWGDTVNTASRMESSGEVGKVNISEATYELLKDDQDFAFESRGKIKAKGKGEIEMLFVKSRK